MKKNVHVAFRLHENKTWYRVVYLSTPIYYQSLLCAALHWKHISTTYIILFERRRHMNMDLYSGNRVNERFASWVGHNFKITLSVQHHILIKGGSRIWRLGVAQMDWKILKTGGGGVYIKYDYIFIVYISHVRCILYTLFSTIFYIVTPLLVQYCNKK